MKKIIVFAIVIVVIVFAGGVSLGQGKVNEKRQKGTRNQSPDQIAWQKKLESMSPEEQKVAKAKRSFEMQVKPWREVRMLAKAENATKTLAAIDRILATKEAQLKRRLASFEKGNTKGQAEKKTPRQGKGKKKTPKNQEQ